MAKKNDSMLELLVAGALVAGGIYWYKTKQATTVAAANTGTISVTLPPGAAVLQPNSGVPQAST